MGMGEGFIKDFQISASSEYEGFPAVNVRPRKSGWCAKSADVHPYIQVLHLTHYPIKHALNL